MWAWIWAVELGIFLLGLTSLKWALISIMGLFPKRNERSNPILKWLKSL